MSLGRAAALDAARNILTGPRAAEAPRLDRIAQAMKPSCIPATPPTDVPLEAQSQSVGYVAGVEIPRDAPPIVKRLALKAETNYIPLVVDVFSQVMKVDGYYAQGSADKASPWEWWQRNRMDARQTGVHRATIQYGASYVVGLPGDTGPVMRGVSPRAMTALYQDPANDEWPILALEVDGDHVLLYDEGVRHRFGVEKSPLRSALMPSASVYYGEAGLLTWIGTETHGVDFPPVVRFRDRMLLEGEEQFGIVEPLLTIQARINQTTFDMLVGQYFQAFKQRYIIGWTTDDEREFLRVTASDVWTFDDDNVKVGELQGADPKGYIDSKASAVRDLSAIGQVPAQNLGIDGISNISDATLAGLETSKDRKGDEIATSLGESWEQALRLCAHLAGDASAAADYTGEVRWKDSTARSLTQAVDALGKQAQMLGVPQELLWEDIPGWTQGKIDRARQMRSEADALASLTTMLDQQAAAGDIAE